MDSVASDALVELVDAELRSIEAGREAQAALDRLTRKLADEVGDMCAVSLLEDETRIVALSLAHRELEAERLLRGTPGVDLSETPVISRVVKTGRPLMVTSTSARQLRSFMSNEIGPYLDAYGMSSLVVVPMRAEGAVLGCLALARTTGGTAYPASAEGGVQRVADELAVALLSSGLLPGPASAEHHQSAQRKPGFGTGLASFIKRGDGPAAV